MSLTFTKLFSSITESTIWVEPYPTRIAWVSMLAMCDRKGRVFASIPGLARRAGITLEECEAALLRFQQPDKYSRTPDNEGRRITPMDGGWQLLNYEKYRAVRDEESRREYQRDWDREKRPGRKPNKSDAPDKSDKNRPPPTQAEAEAEAEKTNPPMESVAVVETPGASNPPPRAPLPAGATDPRVVELHGRCLGARVRKVAVQHAIQWVSDGVTVDVLDAAIERARKRKDGQQFDVGWLQLMLQDVRAHHVATDPQEVIRRTMEAIAEKESRNAAH